MNYKLDYYAILEISHSASEEVIRSAYKALAKKYHPDTNSGDPYARIRMIKINEAYEILSSPSLKRDYDMHWEMSHSSVGMQQNAYQNFSTENNSAPKSQANSATDHSQQNNSATGHTANSASYSSHPNNNYQYTQYARNAYDAVHNPVYNNQNSNNNNDNRQQKNDKLRLLWSGLIGIFVGFVVLIIIYTIYAATVQGMSVAQPVIGIVAVIIGAWGVVFWLKNGNRQKEGAFFLAILGMIIFCLIGFFLIFEYYSYLFERQTNTNSDVSIYVSSENAEETSVLYLLNEVQSDATPEGIVSIFGSGYKVNPYADDKHYTIVYENPSYTLKNIELDQIAIKFNKKGTKLLEIICYKKVGGEVAYYQLFNYLKDEFLGYPKSTSNDFSRIADWNGYHLEVSEVATWFNRVF